MISAATSFINTMYYRHACKAFNAGKKIPGDLFNLILEAGRLSPSSFGFEPWKFLVLQNPGLREKLRECCWGAQGQLPTASHFLILLARKGPSLEPESDYIQNKIMRETQDLPPDIQKTRTQRYREFRDNDFNLSESCRAAFDWSCRQCYIAMANMMTAAAHVKVDSCPIEGFTQKTVDEFLHAEKLMDASEFGVACMVAFGYRAKDPRPKTRRPPAEVLEWVE